MHLIEQKFASKLVNALIILTPNRYVKQPGEITIQGNWIGYVQSSTSFELVCFVIVNFFRTEIMAKLIPVRDSSVG